MKIIKNKKASHVGMIISFVIFITFIVFLYTVIRPAVQTGEDKKTTLQDIEMKMIGNLSANLTTASVSINKNNPSEINIELQSFLINMYLSGVTYYYNTIVKDENNIKRNAYAGSLGAVGAVDTGSIYNLRIERGDKNLVFFKIYFSPKFSQMATSSSSFTMIPTGNYKVGSIDTGKYIYIEQVNGLINNYKDSYADLKDKLKVTPGNEFWFEFFKSDNSEIKPGDEPKVNSVNVYSDKIPIQYFDSNANLLSGYLYIKVW